MKRFELSRNNSLGQEYQQQPEQNSNTKNKKIFLNKFLLKGDFNVLEDSSKTEDVFLVFDKSDGNFEIRKSSNEAQKEEENSNQPHLNYNNLAFDTGDYYGTIKGLPPRLGLEICHSDVAKELYLVDPNPKDIESLHHPRLNIKEIKGKTLSVSIDPKSFVDNEEEHIFLKDFESLSARNGKIMILLEIVSENPPFILNVGMASQLVTYYHMRSSDDKPRLETDTRISYIEPDQLSPMLAPIPKGTPFCTIANNLFEIPVAKHPVENTDFLLIRDMEDKTKFYLRKIDDLYCGSLIEVKSPVFCPLNKKTEEMKTKFISAIVINLFRGTCQYKGREKIVISDFSKEYFPDMNETRIRDIIRNFAKPVKQHGISFLVPKPDLDRLFSGLYIYPEDVCAYQSMLAGLKKLRRNGVHFLVKSKNIYRHIQSLEGDLTKQIAERIELELLRTPWSRTENFASVYDLVEKDPKTKKVR